MVFMHVINDNKICQRISMEKLDEMRNICSLFYKNTCDGSNMVCVKRFLMRYEMSKFCKRD